MGKIKDCSLYLVLTEEYANGRDIFDIAKESISGGVDILQLREKNKPKEDIFKKANEFSRLCEKENIIFIVNDDPLLAKEVDASGVHIGQEDMFKFPVSRIRSILGKDKIVGVSTHSMDQFRLANNSDVDYISFGPIFPTKLKNYFIGTKDIKNVLNETLKPVFFIGGINLFNIDEILQEGARNIALIRGIMEAQDIALKTKAFKDKLKQSEKR